jgi:hypothetical protein
MRGRGHAVRAGARPDGPHGRYGLLLLLLIATYLLSAFTTGDWVGVAQLILFVAGGFLALRASRLPPQTIRLVAVLGVGGSAAAIGLVVTRPSDAAVAAASIWTGLLLLATVVIIVRRILSFASVTDQSIYAAISAYLLLGLMFAAFYAAVALLHGGHFFAGARPGDSKTFQYFSFTTLTTLGYGDFTAAGSGGRAIAVMEALTGLVFLATLVARLVASFRGPAASPPAPADSRRQSGPQPPLGPRPGREPPGAQESDSRRPGTRAPGTQGPGSHGPGGHAVSGQPQARQLPARMRPGRRPHQSPRPTAAAFRRRPPRQSGRDKPE